MFPEITECVNTVAGNQIRGFPSVNSLLQEKNEGSSAEASM